MNTNNIEINTQSSIKIKLNKIIYFDPFEIEEEMHDADIIFITVIIITSILIQLIKLKMIMIYV